MDPFLDNRFLSTKEAATLVGFVPDYVSRLCRQGKIEAKQFGRNWFVDKEALLKFVAEDANRKTENAKKLAHEREEEYRAARVRREAQSPTPVEPVPSPYLVGEELSYQVTPVRGSFTALAVTLLLLTTGVYASLEEVRTGAIAYGAQLLDNSATEVTSIIHSKENARVQGKNLTASVVAETAITGTVSEPETLEKRGKQHSSNGPANFLAGFGAGLSRVSNGILVSYASGITAWTKVTPEIPRQIIAVVHNVGYSTALVANDTPSTVVVASASIEDFSLGVVGHTALAYETTRDTLARAYMQVSSAGYFHTF